MPPQRTRNIADDSRSEVSSTREKYTSLLSTAAPSKGRRNGAGNAGFTSGLKEVTNANQPFNAQQDVPEDDKRIDWSRMDISVLLAYRSLHRLGAPSSFTNSYHERLLTRPGVGRLSPTMARHKTRQRASKKRLIMAVKKSFNNAMVSELDIITSFTYLVHNMDKKFRMRFEPPPLAR